MTWLTFCFDYGAITIVDGVKPSHHLHGDHFFMEIVMGGITNLTFQGNKEMGIT